MWPFPPSQFHSLSAPCSFSSSRELHSWKGRRCPYHRCTLWTPCLPFTLLPLYCFVLPLTLPRCVKHFIIKSRVHFYSACILTNLIEMTVCTDAVHLQFCLYSFVLREQKTSENMVPYFILSWYARWNIFFGCITYTHLIESQFKAIAKERPCQNKSLEDDHLSITFKQTTHTIYCQLSQVAPS